MQPGQEASHTTLERVRSIVAVTAAVGLGGALGAGCLTRRESPLERYVPIQQVGTCLQPRLTPDTCGNLRCLVLETLDPAKGFTQADCASGTIAGVSQPDPQILQAFRMTQHAAWVDGQGPDPATAPICQITQLVAPGSYDVSCATPGAEEPFHYTYPTNLPANGDCVKDKTDAGWCYVEGAATGSACRQAIHFRLQATGQEWSLFSASKRASEATRGGEYV